MAFVYFLMARLYHLLWHIVSLARLSQFVCVLLENMVSDHPIGWTIYKMSDTMTVTNHFCVLNEWVPWTEWWSILFLNSIRFSFPLIYIPTNSEVEGENLIPPGSRHNSYVSFFLIWEWTSHQRLAKVPTISFRCFSLGSSISSLCNFCSSCSCGLLRSKLF